MHKKKRRRSRWSTGYIAKKKSSSSPHVSKDDASDEDEEDGDEDEVEKEGAAENHSGGTKDTQMNQEGCSELNGSELNSQLEETEKEPAAEEEQRLHDEDKLDNDIQEEDEAIQPQTGQRETDIAGDVNNELISDNTKRDSCTKEDGDNQHTITENISQSEMQMEESHGEDQNSELVEAELKTPAEQNPLAEQVFSNEIQMVDATETSTPDASAAARSDTDTNAGWLLTAFLSPTTIGAYCDAINRLWL